MFIPWPPPDPSGLFRICYGVLLVQRTLAFMSSGAVDASFASSGPSSPGGQTATGVLNFGHGFLLLGSLGSPSADAVRSACWCICAAGVAISVGFRPNAVAFTASVMQVRRFSSSRRVAMTPQHCNINSNSSINSSIRSTMTEGTADSERDVVNFVSFRAVYVL